MKKPAQLVLAFLVGGLVVYSMQFVSLGQGRLVKTNEFQLPSKYNAATEEACVFTPKIEASLSANSPMGFRNVSSDDRMVYFDLAAVSDQRVKVGSIKVSFASDSDFDISDLEISAMDGAVRAGISSDSSSGFERIINFDPQFQIEAGTTKTISLRVNSANLIHEDAGQDDPVTITLLEAYDTDGNRLLKDSVTSYTVKY